MRLYNLSLSLAPFAGLYILKKLEAYLQTTRMNYLNSGTGFVKLYLLYTAHKHLTSLRLPLTGFPLYLFDKFNTIYGLSCTLSVITFIMGFPIITSLHYYSQFLLSRTISRISNDYLIVNHAPIPMASILQVLQNFSEALIANQNWSLSYGEWILKSHATLFSEEMINERCPLRSVNTSITSETTCSICMEAIRDQELHRQLPCKHWFHAPCCDQWLMVHGTCPNCRRKI